MIKILQGNAIIQNVLGGLFIRNFCNFAIMNVCQKLRKLTDMSRRHE